MKRIAALRNQFGGHAVTSSAGSTEQGADSPGADGPAPVGADGSAHGRELRGARGRRSRVPAARAPTGGPRSGLTAGGPRAMSGALRAPRPAPDASPYSPR